MSFLAPLFFVGLAAIAIPVLIHLIQRERKDVIPFPSLMFLRRIPYQSVERRRIHNWLLLLLRAAAIALLVAAFSRPFFTQNPLQAAAATTGAREVVILLDHSASMGYADHWDKARAAARDIVNGLGGNDRATLVLFASNVEEAVRATPDRARLVEGIDAATVSSDATRYGPALRLAQSLLSRSDLPRKEAVLISDFQKTGWERREEIHLPEGATMRPISVASPAMANLSVSSVTFAHAPFSGEERVSVTAGLTNRGSTPYDNLAVTLEVEGREIANRAVTLAPNASGSVTFPPFTVSQSTMRGTIHAGKDEMPADNLFHFTLSPSRPVSVLVVRGEGVPDDASLYYSTALAAAHAPAFTVDVVPTSRATPGALGRRSVVVLDDPTALPSDFDAALKRFVEQGGGLLVALGSHTAWANGESPVLPGKLGPEVDRAIGAGATLGFLDFSHPVFELFKDPRNGNFANVRFYRYRAIAPAPNDRVLARFDDGGTAIVERSLGTGRALAFAAPIDTSWSNFPTRQMYPPLMVLLTQYLAQYGEEPAWYTVGRMLDLAAPAAAAMVREGAAGDPQTPVRKPSGVVVSPSGDQSTIGEGGADAVELAQQGFYSVRMQGAGARRPYAVAVNLDPAESDLAPMEPTEFVATVTGRAVTVTPTGESLEHPNLTPQDIERKQSIWWFLLLAGVAALLAEALLSNRLSAGFGRGFLQFSRSGSGAR